MVVRGTRGKKAGSLTDFGPRAAVLVAEVNWMSTEKIDISYRSIGHRLVKH